MTATRDAGDGRGAPLSWGNVKLARRFRAMNTDVELLATDPRPASLLAEAETLFHDVARRLSRFSADSDLSKLNASGGGEQRVSQVLFDALAAALRMHDATQGVFDPSVLADLEALGYDRSFEALEQDSSPLPAPAAYRRPKFAAVRLDLARLTVELPEGMRIDLGGIGKGFAVDLAAAVLRPACDFLVNAGGDIYAEGNGPDGDGWLVSVADPFNPDDDISLLRLRGQALATSTTVIRRWRRAGRMYHHLIDPRTGQPAENGVASVSVVALTATEADVFAKTALILGPEEGKGFLEERGTPGLFVLENREAFQTSWWPGWPPASQ